ncbi:hypothetical protein CTI12_AA288100 [Artemisia annua]|uniref:Endonuclease/exonuclease/phosphatase domain-containing protein n=1 Tax=Artemisia annua TaxID=35608 RepID=A0A2U1NAG5_ARTAN|nr:hypothetical protein CTI12_AA288100 [Artemisia annua]
MGMYGTSRSRSGSPERVAGAGNQNLIVGKVQIHTSSNGLINESLIIKVCGKSLKVNVIEELRDISEYDIEATRVTSHEEQVDNGVESNKDRDDMIVSEEEGDRKKGDDEESRVSLGTRVGDSFEGDNGNSKASSMAVNNGYPMEGKEKSEKDCRGRAATKVNIDDIHEGNIIQNGEEIGGSRPGEEIKLGQDNNNIGLVIEEGNMNNKCEPNNETNNHIQLEEIKSGDKNKQRRINREKRRHNREIEHTVNESNKKREKRGDTSSDESSSEGDRCRKKRKSNFEGVIENIVNGNCCTQGAGDEIVDSGKRKIGRRSIKKAMKVARHTGVEGLGEDVKGISEAYKEYHDAEDESDGRFVFKSTRRGEEDNQSCSINMEQVKEIGEIIGVSWVKAVAEKENEESGDIEKNDEADALLSINVRGMGEVGKIGWVKSIIKDERPDIIGIQETKSGIVNEYRIEEIWGGKGFGFTQIEANGSSGGILLIWDTNVFTCSDAMGDDRFIAIKGDWKGRNGDVYFACIYGPHVGRHKASLWERLSGLMNNFSGAWCIFGDLNVVRRTDDRFNSQHMNNYISTTQNLTRDSFLEPNDENEPEMRRFEVANNSNNVKNSEYGIELCWGRYCWSWTRRKQNGKKNEIYKCDDFMW